MDIMTRAKFHFNRLMLSLIFGVWASEPPPLGPGERLKRPGLIGLKRVNRIWTGRFANLKRLGGGGEWPLLTWLVQANDNETY